MNDLQKHLGGGAERLTGAMKSVVTQSLVRVLVGPAEEKPFVMMGMGFTTHPDQAFVISMTPGQTRELVAALELSLGVAESQ